MKTLQELKELKEQWCHRSVRLISHDLSDDYILALENEVKLQENTAEMYLACMAKVKEAAEAGDTERILALIDDAEWGI